MSRNPLADEILRLIGAPFDLVYGTATNTNTVQIDGAATAVQLPAVVNVVSGDYCVIAQRGADKLILGPVGGPQVIGYTPALTAVTTSPTLGTGSSAGGYYQLVGRRIDGIARIVFGTSGVAAGSGTYRISLPVAADTTVHAASGTGGQGSSIGTWNARDNSPGAFRQGTLQLVSASTAMLDYTTTAVSSSAPWTWAASDAINISFSYFKP